MKTKKLPNSEKVNTAIARKLRMLRAAKNVGWEEFSRYLGYSRFTISSWESGESEPSAEQKGLIEAEFAEVLRELHESEDGKDSLQAKYLICLKCLPDLSETHLKDLNSSITNLLKVKEKKRKQNFF